MVLRSMPSDGKSEQALSTYRAVPVGMKCPRCGGEMEEGVMIISGGVTQNAHWKKKEGESRFLGEKIISTHVSPTRLSGFRCRSCGCMVIQNYE